MIKKTLEPSSFSPRCSGGRVRVGFRIPAFFLLSLFLTGCQGNSDVTPPSLPADVINVSQSGTISIAPAAAASGDRIYIAWNEQTANQDFEIFLSTSTDGGNHFTPPINVSQSIASSINPRVALSGNTLYLVWEEFITEKNESDILFRKAEDQGGTFIWTPPLDQPGRNLSASATSCKDDSKPATPAPCPSQFPDIVVEGNRVFIAWAEENHYIIAPISPGQTATDFKLFNSDIQMVTSQDGGVQFTPPFNVSGDKSGGTPCGSSSTETASLNPALAAADGRLYLSWEDCTRPNSKVLFRRFPDSLNIAPPSQQPAVVSDPAKSASRPALAAEGNQVHAAWEEFSIENSATSVCTRTDIFYATSLQQGIDFFDPSKPAAINLSGHPCGFGSNSAKLAAAGPSVYVAWEGNAPDTTGLSLKRSGDGGKSFAARENLSQTGGSAGNPALAAFGGLLYAFWEDSTLGNLEIVFARR